MEDEINPDTNAVNARRLSPFRKCLLIITHCPGDYNYNYALTVADPGGAWGLGLSLPPPLSILSAL